MAARPPCTECGGDCKKCGGSMEGKPPHARTCCTVCRSKRSRRLRRQKVRVATEVSPGYDDYDQSQTAQVARGVKPDVLRDVMKEELRPVVREAITEDTLRALHDLVALTPRAVECIAEDLHCDDATIRQRAYTLLTKYTIGHQAIVRPEESHQGQQMVVNFNLPRPGAETQEHDGDVAVELEAAELRTCDMCAEEKPITDFVANSHRCAVCYEQQRDLARALMKDGG